MTTLPLDDQGTYEMLARGDSTGVFQFESEGMREALKKVRPDEFNDLIALNALYRPGAMDQIPVYAKGKHDPASIGYRDERLRPILESSKGVILYQEQAMQISKEIAGFSGAKADDLRKAIGKKKREAMAALKPEFVEGCRASGTRAEVIEFLWQTNEKSADYSFNKSHAACYALIAYRTAWLKANHPAEYMAALISSVMSTKDKVPFFVARCEEMGIEILPPDVNLSDHEFTVVERNIRFGLDAVKGVGYQAVEAIKRARGERTGDVGNQSPVRLAVGLLRARGQSRGQQEGDRGADQVRCARLDRRHPQGDARGARAGPGGGPEGPAGRADRAGLDLRPQNCSRTTAAPRPARRPPRASRPPVHPPIPSEEFDQPELLAAEKEAIGLFVSAHPLKPLREAMRARVDCPHLGARGSPRQGPGDGRRDHHRDQAHPHPQRRPHDVRHARRSRRVGRDAGVRQGAGRARGGAAGRRGGDGEGAGRPQGSRQHLPDRAERAGVRARRRRRSSGRARRQARRRASRPPKPGRCICGSPPTGLSATVVEDSGRRSRTSPGRPRWCSRSTPPDGGAWCVSARPSACSHTPSLRAELETALGPAKAVAAVSHATAAGAVG